MMHEPPEAFFKSATAFFGAGAVAVTCVTALAATTGLLLLTTVIAPDLTGRCAGALRRRHFLSWLAGLGVLVAFVIGAVVVQRVQILGVPWMITAVIGSIVGLASTSEDIGRRLFWICGRDGNRALHVMSGWSIFLAAAAIPFVGWFLVAPYGLIVGLGSCVTGCFTREDGAAKLPPAPAPPPLGTQNSEL